MATTHLTAVIASVENTDTEQTVSAEIFADGKPVGFVKVTVDRPDKIPAQLRLQAISLLQVATGTTVDLGDYP